MRYREAYVGRGALNCGRGGFQNRCLDKRKRVTVGMGLLDEGTGQRCSEEMASWDIASYGSLQRDCFCCVQKEA